MVFTEIDEAGSFRDPAGQIIIRGGAYLRKVSPSYMPEYCHLMTSGLYGELTDKGLLLPHSEERAISSLTFKRSTDAFVIIPEQLRFISYPYEWCFGMLKEAALNTLEINRIALNYGMMLKDASAYNMQWHKGKMTLIDSLSFIRYDGNQPWRAYRQFLEHFLVPLLLVKYKDASLSKLAGVFIEGIPIGLAVKLLPRRLMLNLSLSAHLYAQNIATGKVRLPKEVRMPRRNLDALLDNLKGLIVGLSYTLKSPWTLYDSCSYTLKAFKSKSLIVDGMLDKVPLIIGNGLLDVGANTGVYSSLAQSKGYDVIAIDNDHDCVEYIYQAKVDILPLVADICNPTSAVGWGNTERRSLLERLNVETIMALALIHHICIGNNIPLRKVAELFAGHCTNLIIEFVPPDDPKAKLLAGDKVFPPYSKDSFEAEFGRYFNTAEKKDIEDSLRSVYLMRRM